MEPITRYDRHDGRCLTVDCDALKAARLAKGLTQAELGEAVGMSQRVIACYEVGDRVPSFDVAAALLRFLGPDCGIEVDA